MSTFQVDGVSYTMAGLDDLTLGELADLALFGITDLSSAGGHPALPLALVYVSMRRVNAAVTPEQVRQVSFKTFQADADADGAGDPPPGAANAADSSPETTPGDSGSQS